MTDQTTTDPGGCRHCGISKREHMQRWTAGVGWHTHTSPSLAQIKARMLTRRKEARS